jgi:hypothetical protein
MTMTALFAVCSSSPRTISTPVSCLTPTPEILRIIVNVKVVPLAEIGGVTNPLISYSKMIGS